ncbi:MAG: sulfatase family protein [Coraliomargarita sp.]
MNFLSRFFVLILLPLGLLAVPPKPNIIMILCDDLGYGDLGITGHPYAKSPNIDRLAKEGIQFTQAYQSSAWCAPSRYALMSGVYPARKFQHTLEMNTAEPNLYRILDTAGYRTGHFGKWHMSGRAADALIPADYGVHEYFIHNGNDEGWTPKEKRAPHWREQSTAHYVDRSIEFIKKQKESDQPFYVNLWVYPTHSYIDPIPEMLEEYKDLEVNIDDFENPLMREFLNWISEQGDLQDAMRAYCADITELDKQVGRLMHFLQDAGLDESTMVIFASDNGPPPLDPAHYLDDLTERMQKRPTLINCVGSAGPYRARKMSLNDGGVRTPLFVRWPGMIPAGKLNHETIFTGVDWLPTLASVANAQTPANLDGVDLAEALFGAKIERAKVHFWNDRSGWTTLRDKQWKAHLQEGQLRLFDIIQDPSESNDVSQQFPEISKDYAQRLQDFEASISRN